MKATRIHKSWVVLGAVLTALAMTVPSSVLAKHHHKKPMHVTVTRWDLQTVGGTTTSGSPGGTITHCASDRAQAVYALGNTKHAKAHKVFTVRFLLNGVQQLSTHESYPLNGPGPFNDGIVNNIAGLGDGLWSVKVVQKGKTVGQSSVTIAANPSC